MFKTLYLHRGSFSTSTSKLELKLTTEFPKSQHSIQAAIKSSLGLLNPWPFGTRTQLDLMLTYIHLQYNKGYCGLGNYLKYLGFRKLCVISSSSVLEAEIENRPMSSQDSIVSY